MASPNLDLTEKPLASQRHFEGRVIQVRRDEVELPNGKRGFREVIEHPGGVVVLPLLADGRVVFVEQYRYALGRTLLELPAGKLEPGEVPLEAIQRELQEETGYQADAWEELTYIYTAPGFCNEKLWLYKATGLRLVDEKALHGVGHADHHDPNQVEFLYCKALTLEEITEKIRGREIVDAKTLSLLALVFRFLD